MVAVKSIRLAFRFVGGTIKWALIVGALLIVVVIIVALVAIGKGVAHGDKTYARVTPLMRHVRLGETPAQVRAQLGKPDRTSSTQTVGETDVYWYYGVLSGKDAFGWQLVFTNGKLTAKNRD